MTSKWPVLTLLFAITCSAFGQTVQLSWITLQRTDAEWQVTRLAPEAGWQVPLAVGEALEAADDHRISAMSPQALFRLLQTATTRQLRVRVIGETSSREVRLFANSPERTPAFQRFGLGASVSDIDDRGGSIVRRVVSKSPAEDAGLKVGDVITAVNSESLGKLQTAAFLAKLSSVTSSPIDLTVARSNEVLAIHVIRNRRIEELMPDRAPQIPADLIASTGDRAPDISVSGPVGPLKLDSLRGNWVFISFWATWCEPCVQEIPKVNELTFKPNTTLTVWGVALEQTGNAVQEFLRGHALSYPVALGGDFSGAIAKAYFVTTLPENVLIGPEGNIRWVGDTIPDAAAVTELMSTPQ